MAINPLISLQVQTPQASQAINIFENALMNKQTRNLRASQEQRAAEQAPLQNQILQQQLAAGEAQAQQAQDQRILKSINDFAVGNASIITNAVNSGDFKPLQSALIERRLQLQQQNLPTDQTDELIFKLGQGDGQSVVAGLSDAVNLFQQQQGRTADQRRIADIKRDLQGAIDPTTGQLIPEKDMTAIQRIAAIDAKLISGAGTLTSAERLGLSKEKTEGVADSQATIAGRKEDAKFRSKQKFAAEINRDIKLAEAEATARGETLTDLSRAKAALPGIEKVVGKLMLLADEATFTLAGGAWDSIAKQLFGVSTKGSTAKAKMVSMVDNQVLPMLKPIFGAAFTAAEGDRLRDAMLDPDSTPESRKAQLSSFLGQMRENIAGKERELQSSRPRLRPTRDEAPAAETPKARQVGRFTVEEL